MVGSGFGNRNRTDIGGERERVLMFANLFGWTRGLGAPPVLVAISQLFCELYNLRLRHFQAVLKCLLDESI